MKFAGAREFILFLCLALFLSLPVKADEFNETDNSAPTTDSLINAYYNRCVNSVFQDLAPETREEFCACTAAQVKDQMIFSELETMATGKGKSVDPQKLAVKVMAPCLSAPMDEIEYNSCLNDITYAHMFKNQESYNTMCHCISSGVSRFMTEVGGDLMAMLVQRDASSAENPTESIRANPEYMKERNRLRKGCMSDNAPH